MGKETYRGVEIQVELGGSMGIRWGYSYGDGYDLFEQSACVYVNSQAAVRAAKRSIDSKHARMQNGTD